MFKKFLLSLLTIATLSTTVMAQTNTNYGVGLKLSTLGIGLDLIKPINDSFALRLNINGASYSENDVESGINYDYDLTLVTAGLLIDYYPLESAFRVSAGAYYNANEYKLKALTTDSLYEIAGNYYTTEQVTSIDGLMEFDTLSPYVGIGWGRTPKPKEWNFSIDVGVLYHGAPSVELSAQCGAVDCDKLQQDIAQEQQELLDVTKDYTIYPVISVGLSYAF